MNARISFLALLLMSVGITYGRQYPDSVRQQSEVEARIATGFVLDIDASIGLGGSSWGDTDEKRHFSQMPGFPYWNAGIGLNWYFLPYMGIGTGAHFSQHTNHLRIDRPFSVDAKDKYSDSYTLTATPEELTEKQMLYSVDIPLMLLFRYMPGRVGFTGRIGAKFGLPMWGTYSLSEGKLQNQVYYPHWDLRMEDVPGVIEDQTIAPQGGRTDGWIQSENSDDYRLSPITYTGYLEAGVLFQLSQRIDLGLTLFGQYTFSDVKTNYANASTLGFGEFTSGEYPSPFLNGYEGIWNTREVEYVRPWSVGVKLSLQVNAGRAQAQKEYDKQQRQRRKEALQARRDSILEVQQQARLQAEALPVQEEDTITPEERRKQQAAALQTIDSLAEHFQIDLCDRCHDTIYVYREIYVRDTIYQVDTIQEEQPVIDQLDEVLASAVIFFDVNSTTPKIQPADLLERIATILRRHPHQRVAIHGHASKEGNPELNKRLAKNRAAAVASLMRNLGVRDEQMAIASFGARRPYKTGKEHNLKQDRRVEIFPLSDISQHDETIPDNYTIRCTEVVQQGSRLAQIARRHYGDPGLWKLIYEANKDIISDPSNLPVGITLRIPEIPKP